MELCFFVLGDSDVKYGSAYRDFLLRFSTESFEFSEVEIFVIDFSIVDVTDPGIY